LNQKTVVDALIVDTQGSELLVLQGAGGLLKRAKYVKAEAADFSSYNHGCVYRDVKKFLEEIHYEEKSRLEFASLEGVGRYYDVIFANTSN
jgi:hypothetical protein